MSYLFSKDRNQDAAEGKAEGEVQSKISELPALILLDLKLPKIDGSKFSKAFALCLRWPIFLSSSYRPLESDINRARVLGVADYLVKPVDWQEFSRVLCKTLPLNINTDSLS